MTKFELSHAYPFMSLSFVFVLALSGFFFHESIALPKVFGVLLMIMTGIIVGARGEGVPVTMIWHYSYLSPIVKHY